MYIVYNIKSWESPGNDLYALNNDIKLTCLY